MTYINALGAFTDPTRRTLLETLRRGPASVAQLQETVSVSQPAVSQHLRVLREAGLVQVERRGQQRIYRLDRRGLADLRAYLDTFWDDVLDAYEQAAIAQDAETKRLKEKRK